MADHSTTDPIEHRHEQYVLAAPMWRRCRDADAGLDALRRAATLYVPKLSGQEKIHCADGSVIDEYEAYLHRAVWNGYPHRLWQAMTGMLMRKMPDVRAPDRTKTLLQNITNDGVSFAAYAKRVVRDVLTVGRIGGIVDFSSSLGRPFAATYAAENVDDWYEESWNGIKVLTYLKVRERVTMRASHGFGGVSEQRYATIELLPLEVAVNEGRLALPPAAGIARGDRELVTPFGVVVRKEFRKQEDGKWALIDLRIPHRGNDLLPQIPFCFTNACEVGADVEKPPLLDFVDLALAHYRNSADHENLIHHSGQATLALSGFPLSDGKGNKIHYRIGGNSAMVSSEPNAKAQWAALGGDESAPLEKSMESKEDMMAISGGRLLETSKRSVEAADTLMVRYAGDQATLLDVATTVSEGLTSQLAWLAWWSNPSLSISEAREAVAVDINKDFLASMLPSEDFVRLVAGMQMAGFSETLVLEASLRALERGERITAEMVAGEIERIRTGAVRTVIPDLDPDLSEP